MRIRLERPTALPPDRLYAWWTDLREGHADHAWLPGSADVGRRLLSRGADRVEVEDRGRFLGLPLVEHYTTFFRPDRREVALHGGNNFARFSAVYRFEGGRATLDATVAPLGLLALFDPVLRPLVRRFLAKDLEGHLRDAEAELTA